MSISMTDFMALGESWEIGARKFPAAPALQPIHSVSTYDIHKQGLPKEEV